MITRLSLENFQCWRKVDLDLGRITMLYGANSSGKTALLRSLLLIRQTAASRLDFSLGLGEEGRTVDLGSWQDVAHRRDLKAAIGVGFEFQADTGERSGQSFKWVNEDSRIRLRDQRVAVPGFTVSMRYEAEKSQRVDSDNEFFTDAYKDVPSDISREGLTLRTLPLTERPLPQEVIDAHSLVLQTTLAHDLYFRHLDYQGPLRWPFKRLYPTAGSEIREIGSEGRLAVDAYWRSLHGATDEQIRGHDIVPRVNEWLANLGLVESFEVRSSGSPANVAMPVVRTPGSASDASAADVGFGVSQAFPTLTRAYFAPVGSMLLVEQPEAHLHPASQAAMADFLLRVAEERQLQLLIESHSEYLLARLQRRMAEAEQPLANPDDLKIYFCENHPEGAKAKLLETDEYGHILNWPEGFFGDTMGDMIALEKARLAREQKKAASA